MSEVDVLVPVPVTERVCNRVWFVCEVSMGKKCKVVVTVSRRHYLLFRRIDLAEMRPLVGVCSVCACVLGHRMYASLETNIQIHGIPPEQS